MIASQGGSPKHPNWYYNLRANPTVKIQDGSTVYDMNVTEINDAKEINAICILDDGKAIDISQLSSLIKDSSFVIANDTGPAHMAAHLNAKGLTLFGSHTTAHKVSIERDNFKVMQVSDLNKLSAIEVFKKLTNFLN